MTISCITTTWPRRRKTSASTGSGGGPPCKTTCPRQQSRSATGSSACRSAGKGWRRSIAEAGSAPSINGCSTTTSSGRARASFGSARSTGCLHATTSASWRSTGGTISRRRSWCPPLAVLARPSLSACSPPPCSTAARTSRCRSTARARSVQQGGYRSGRWLY